MTQQAANQFGISVFPVEDALTRQVRSLEVENDAVVSIFNAAFPLHRVILQQTGNDLRSFVRTIAQIVLNEIVEYRALFRNKLLPKERQALSDDHLRGLEQQFELLIRTSPNDNISRVRQLGVFFSALVIENAFFAVVLPEAEQSMRRFAPDDTLLVNDNAALDELHSSKFLNRRALVAFVTKYLPAHFTKLIDGTNEVLESIDVFVEACVNDYCRQLPCYLPRALAPDSALPQRR